MFQPGAGGVIMRGLNALEMIHPVEAEIVISEGGIQNLPDGRGDKEKLR